MPTVTVISPNELNGNKITKPGVIMSLWSDYQRHYLAEGDSWFSLSAILSPSFLYRFGFNVPLKQDTLIVNCSYPGDTLQHMVDWTKNNDFPRLLTKQNFAYQWDGVLLSAGGNDIIDAALSPDGILQSCTTPTGPRDFIAYPKLTILENHLREYFSYLVSLRNASSIPANRTIPVFYHTYGYPTPRNAPTFPSGPWLYKAFTDKHIPEQYWNDLADILMDELAKMLRRFGNLGSNLNVVDTLANVPLIRAVAGSTGSSGDWLNEIHLNDSGKDKVASYWAKYLCPVWPLC
jgi:GDSL-like Lipase/Acylhydrolase